MRVLAALLMLPPLLFAAERNVVFFITDDESPTLGCYGDPVAKTPAIDALAADGTLFLNAFATTASCSASRSVVLSGIHNHKNGQFGHSHDYHKFASFHNVVSFSLPRALARENYRTIHVGKFHVAPEEVYHFDTYLSADSRNTVAMAEAVKDAVTADDERLFFLYFAPSDPHRGGGSDQTVEGPYKPDLFGNLPKKRHHKGVDEVFYDPKSLPVPAFLPDTPQTRDELAQYYQSCSRVDQGLARLVEILKAANLYDKTLIVFTSDHGMAFAGGKTTVYEGGLRVPFVVRNPYQTTRGVRSQAMISHVDVTPSLLDFAGGLDDKHNRPKKWINPSAYWNDKPYAKDENRGGRFSWKAYQGRSWLPILATENPAGWDEIFASHTFHEIQMYYPMRVYRDRKYKLIWNVANGQPYPFASDLWAASSWQAQWDKGENAPYGQRTVGAYIHRPPFELYAIDTDPHESTNLADNPEFAAVLLSYKNKLKNLQKKLEDPWAVKWRYE